MSYYNAMLRAHDRNRSLERDAARDLKQRTFEVELLDFFDESDVESFEIAEQHARYAIAH